MAAKPIPPELLSLRRQNALALFVRWRLKEIANGRAGGDKAFAEAVGIDNAHWSRLKAGTPLGPKLARRLETACGVEEGWLDRSHGDAPEVATEGAGESAPSPPEQSAGTPSPASVFEANAVDLIKQLELNQSATFITRVRGQSMVHEGIHDGDLIVVNRSLTPKHGDLVVAVVDNEVTLKTLYQKDGLTKLVSTNLSCPEIVLKEGQSLPVWGVMTACVKLFGHKA